MIFIILVYTFATKVVVTVSFCFSQFVHILYTVSELMFHKYVVQLMSIGISWCFPDIPYFPAHKTHRDVFVRNFRKNNDECILILVNYWKKTGLLHTKISNIIEWCQISWFGSKFHCLMIKMYNRCMGIYKFGNNTYPRCIRRRSNLGHIFWGKKVRPMGQEIQ
jgi:hypothetical protein